MNIPFNYVFTINIWPNRACNKKRTHRLNGNRWVNGFDPLDACDAPALVNHLTLFDPIYPLSSLSDIQRCWRHPADQPAKQHNCSLAQKA